MAKKRKDEALKLPKRLLGIKVPKQTRRSLNRLLRPVARTEANTLVAAAVGAMITAIAERIEKPLEDLGKRGNDKVAKPAAPDAPPAAAPLSH